MNCIHCGADLPAEARFCMECGKPVLRQPGSHASQEVEANKGDLGAAAAGAVLGAQGPVHTGGRRVSGDLVQGSKTDIDTGGGASVGGSVSVSGGDFTGRDRITTIAGSAVIRVQYNSIGQKRERPATAEILSYLKSFAAPGQNEKKPELRRFFQADFYVSAAEALQELGQGIQQIWQGGEKDRPPAIILLAEGGSGKTLALRQLCARLAAQTLRDWKTPPSAGASRPAKLPWPPSAPIPLMINLADLQPGLSILSLARAAFNGKALTLVQDNQVEELLPACAVFLDGLDEIPHGGGTELIRLFVQEHPQARFVITARPTADYQQLGSLVVLRLLDLDEQQVQQIMGERWQTTNESVRQLARNRTLLKLVLDQKDDPTILTKGHLVRARVSQQLQAIPNPVERELVDGILSRLAFAMQCEQVYRFPENKVLDLIAACFQEWHEGRSVREMSALLRDDSAALLERGKDGLWAFRARLNQSYFAALEITRRPALLEDALAQAPNPWWYELWELLVGLADDPLELMLNVIDRDPVPAAHFLAFSGVPLSPSLAEALFDGLKERRSFGRSTDREAVVECLGWYNHPAAREVLLEIIEEESYSSVVLRGSACYCRLVQQDPPAPGPARPKGKKTSVASLFGLWREFTAAKTPAQQEEIVEQLAGYVQSDKPGSRASGIAAILLGFIGSERARAVLHEEFLKTNRPKFIAWCTTDALGQVPHPQTEQLALQVIQDERFQVDDFILLRARAIRLLGWLNPSETGRELVRRSLSDAIPEIRRRAAQALGQWRAFWARDLLEDQLRREKDEKVVDKIVQSLGAVGTAATLPLLEASLKRSYRAATRRHIRDALDEIRLRHAA